ncbi:MAG: glycosyltransferase, partial [Candidatus Omnitrophica bacterium]|nr:glycosyltransferase [Candidatus Omnitrophota bacterium]
MSLQVLHLPTNIANQTETLVAGLRQHGWKADALIYRSSFFAYPGSSPGLLDRHQKWPARGRTIFKTFLNLSRRCDILHFYSGQTFLPGNKDLFLLKMAGRKMLMHYWGTDIRLYSQAFKKNQFLSRSLTLNLKRERRRMARIRRVAKIIPTALVADLELKSYLQGFFKKVILLPQAIDTSQYPPSFPSPAKTRPLIIHVPSFQLVKGPEYILRAIENLKLKHDFDFCLLSRVPHEKVRSIINEADIVIDQLLLGTFGIFALEAMASGKPVVCYLNDAYRQSYPDSLPIVSANLDNLETVLEPLIS